MRELVTSQPEVVCGVCGRRLLRGEQPDRFLADAQTYLVCDLCSVRARQLGWVRAAEVSREARPLDARQGSRPGLLDLLRRWRTAAGRAPAATGKQELSAAENEASALGGPSAGGEDGAPRAEHPAHTVRAVRAARTTHEKRPADQGAAPQDAAPQAGAHQDPAILTAIDAFNDTEEPRRIASVARSLGPPWVTVRDAGVSASAVPSPRDPGAFSTHAGRVAVVAAWELCWYRWEVCLDGNWPSAELVARGVGLDELPGEDLAANAVVNERGMVSLASAPVRALP
jgi:hypothetical protein